MTLKAAQPDVWNVTHVLISAESSLNIVLVVAALSMSDRNTGSAKIVVWHERKRLRENGSATIEENARYSTKADIK